MRFRAARDHISLAMRAAREGRARDMLLSLGLAQDENGRGIEKLLQIRTAACYAVIIAAWVYFGAHLLAALLSR